MTAVQVALPEKLIPVFSGRADVRASYGGRGSAKTFSFALMAAVRGYIHGQAGESGIILCARQHLNSLADSSLEAIKRAIESEPWLRDYYEIGETYIRSRDKRIAFAFAGLDRNIDSIKSKTRLLLVWVDEAEPVTEDAWRVLIPTLREEGSDWNAELWVTWNPKRKTAPVEARFRNSTDPLVKVVELNWRDNPKFPEKLERERQRDLKQRPEDYKHVWEGGYLTAIKGSYYEAQLLAAEQDGRIGRVGADPLMRYRAFADIGGTGARSDNFVFWIAQFIGREVRILNHYEVQGQPVGSHLAWMAKRKYTPDNTDIWLPHDGATFDRVIDVSYQSALIAAEYDVEVVPNMGKGAAATRIEAFRRVFPSCWFNAETTQAGRDALGWYHEKWDDKRDVGLGPEHDWASHSADAGGLMAVVYENTHNERKARDKSLDRGRNLNWRAL